MNFKSVSKKDWKLKLIDNNKVLYIKEKFFFSEILSKLLVAKNIDPNYIKLFLNPNFNDYLLNQSKLLDVNKSVNYIFETILQNKPIGIFGDYDVDGASSTAILIKFFNHIKHPCKFLIPDRIIDGYGPTISTFDKLIKQNVSTIITVDCGTQSYKPIEYANSKNVKTIVIDHHQAEVKLPDAFAIINPTRIDDNSNFNMLCATSLTYLFLYALNKKLNKENWYNKKDIKEPLISDFLDLVALATICDVVPLVGINRYFVKEGITLINKKKNIGLNSISEICKLNTETEEDHLGFFYGPRINAGGRLGYSSYGVKLLSSDNKDEAVEICLKLDSLNEKRKKIENLNLNKINKLAEKQKNLSVLVLYDADFHEGLIGILASRIKDKFNKPVVVLSGNSDELKGSARSITGFNIGQEIIKLVKNKTIIRGGGHKMAAGFTIKKKKIDDLIEKLNLSFHNKFKNEKPFNTSYIDSIISTNAINYDFFNEFKSLAPFGNGNSSPTFLIEKVKIIKFKIIKDKHISVIFLSKNGKSTRGMCFNSIGTLLEPYLVNKNNNLNLVGKIKLNKWNNQNQIQFIINDILLN